MEVVAAVSSVVSIVSLLSQCIGSTKALRDFFADVSSASTIVKTFLHDVESLIQSLQAVKDLLLKLPSDIGCLQVLRLRIDLEDYLKDATRWAKLAKVLQPASLSGAKAYFKKFSIAVKSKSVKDIWEELERYKSAISLSLVILGRELDLYSAAHITQLHSKIGEVSVTTLSKIEGQAARLEKVESCSRRGARNSAASFKSLQSVETSLSRIETLLSSAGSEARSRSATSSKDRIVSRRHKRRATGDFDRRARSSTAGSEVSRAQSSASAKSLPNVPTIPKGHLPTQAVTLANKQIPPWRRQSYSEVIGSGWSDYADDDQDAEQMNLRRQSYPEVIGSGWSDYADDDQDAEQINLYSTTSAILGPTFDLCPQPDGRSMIEQATISTQHVISQITQNAITQRHSTDVLDYISLIQNLQTLENRMSLFNLFEVGVTIEARLDVVVQARSSRQDQLRQLLAEVTRCRKRCILAGHSLHEIDSRLRPRPNNSYLAQHSPDQFFDCTLTSIYYPNGRTCLAEHASLSVYGDWSNRRDRINRWLLHCLQSDNTQCQLHRSMLADPLRDEQEWARNTLMHWYSDDAAMGEEVDASLSGGAIYGAETTESSIGFDSDIQKPSSSKCSDMFLSIFNMPILREGGEIYFPMGENGHEKGERASL